jgi:hypothetical protein
MRPSRVVAVAWRDLRLVHGGKGGWKLPVVALLLLLPAGALPSPEAPLSRGPRASGDIPAALASKIEHRPRNPVQLVGSEPVVVRSSQLPDPLREALDTLPGPSVRLVRSVDELRLPGRSLLVALLAISLLTGPLAESLAGERKRGTLETLLTAGLSRFELIAGKWLAWTGAASASTLVVAISGILGGSQDAGLWPIGLPLVAASAVALGLWLGRGAADEIAGAARTMRVLPVAAFGLGLLAYALSTVSEPLGAAVPLGGALLVAGDLLQGPVNLGASALGTALGVAPLLGHTGASLDEVGLRRPRRLGELMGLVGAAAVCWWLPVAGPAAWALAGNPELAARLPRDVALMTAGALLASIALVEHLRDHQPWELPDGRRLALGIPAGLGLGLALGLLALPVPEQPILAELAPRLSSGLVPLASLPAALLVVVGLESLFRGLLQRRYGPLVSTLAWTLICCPLDPLVGLLSGLSLSWVARRGGWLAAALAHAIWAAVVLI